MNHEEYGRELARSGVDEDHLDDLVHGRDRDGLRRFTTAEACQVLNGFYRQKRETRESCGLPVW
jgi:hypothetical protein